MKGLVLLLLAASAVAREPDLDEIVATMRAREAASYPFFMRYRIDDKRRQGHFWVQCHEGWIVRDHNWIVRRTETWRPRDGFSQQATDEAAHIKIDRIDVALPDRSAFRLIRPVGGADTEWRGKTRFRKAIAEDSWRRPSQFGLRWNGQDVSAVLDGWTARVLGQEPVDGRPCVKVMVDLSTPNGEEPRGAPVPLVFWLSKEHGYYPLRCASFGRVKKTVSYVEGEGPDLTVDGHRFEIRFERITDELAKVGDAWLPVRGRALDSGVAISYKAELDSIRVGEIPSSLYLLRDVERAEVREGTSDESFVLEFVEPDPNRPGGAIITGLVRRASDDGIPFWMFAVVGGIGLVLGALLAYRRRDRG